MSDHNKMTSVKKRLAKHLYIGCNEWTETPKDCEHIYLFVCMLRLEATKSSEQYKL